MDCRKCGGCCNHTTIRISNPKSKLDYDEIIWLLLHKGVSVWISKNNRWYIDFITPCEWQNGNNTCKVYDKRPKVCKDYSPNECIINGDSDDGGSEEKELFHTRDDFIEYLNRKNIKYEFRERGKKD